MSVLDLQTDPAIPPRTICESAWCLMAVLHLGKPQKQPVARQFELGLEIRCRCCFYGTLNISRFGPKKGTTDRAMSLMLSLTSCREIVSEPQFSYMERVVLFPLFSLYLGAIVGIKWDVDKPSVTCRALCMCTICTCNSYFMNRDTEPKFISIFHFGIPPPPDFEWTGVSQQRE